MVVRSNSFNKTGTLALWRFVEVYGRMQLADYLVSTALQINNDCLQHLSRVEGELTRQELRLVMTSAEQLSSFWQMLHWSVGRTPYRDAVRRLQLAQAFQPALDSPFGNPARQLRKKSGGAKTGRAIRRASDLLIRQLVGQRPDPGQVERLARVFQDESACWRDYSQLRQISDDDLIVNGIVRAYARGRRYGVRLIADKGRGDGVSDKPRKLKRAIAWVRHSVNHLALLRPALSDANVKRLWYLQKLDLNLVKQLELDAFLIGVSKLEIKAKARRRIEQAATEYQLRIMKQRKKLFGCCYGAKKREFLNSIREDVHNLGLQEVILLPTDKARYGELG